MTFDLSHGGIKTGAVIRLGQIDWFARRASLTVEGFAGASEADEVAVRDHVVALASIELGVRHVECR
jgi:hypothetical protein